MTTLDHLFHALSSDLPVRCLASNIPVLEMILKRKEATSSPVSCAKFFNGLNSQDERLGQHPPVPDHMLKSLEVHPTASSASAILLSHYGRGGFLLNHANVLCQAGWPQSCVRKEGVG